MKKLIIGGVIFIFLIIFLVFIYNDDFLYKKEIMKITKIDTISEDTSVNMLGLEEKYYEREITGIITNGKNKGKKITVTYSESYSSVVTEKYKVNDKVILDHGEIDILKRDFYIALLISLFILALYIIGNIKGLLSIVSVILNVIIFYIGLILYFKGINLLLLCMIEIVFFAVLSLMMAGGINKKTLSAIISVLVSISLILIMLLIIVKTTDYKGINFNELSFLTVPIDDIILPELLVGSVGAIMDVAITMSASIKELIDKDNNISVKSLKKSAKEIGKDIMSTMSNVLFFTYLCASLPLFILAIRNGFSVSNFISSNISFELTRFLVGSIGIVLTIPVASFITIKMFKRGEV